MSPGRCCTQPRRPAIIAGMSNRRFHSGLLGLAILGCAALLACGGNGPAAESASRGGTPLGRSSHPRSGQFTYRLSAIEQHGSEVRVDFSISNGTHRDYNSVLIRVVLFGNSGEIRTVELPIGAMRAEQRRPRVARLEDVPFQVRDITLELVYALP